jgi:hypothetical protein
VSILILNSQVFQYTPPLILLVLYANMKSGIFYFYIQLAIRETKLSLYITRK